MNYNKVLQLKNKIIFVALFISVLLRGVLIFFSSKGINAKKEIILKLGITSIIVFIIAGILMYKKLTKTTMYYMIVAVTVIQIVVLYSFPSLSDFCLLYYTLFLIGIYLDVRPICIQGIINCIIAFRFYKEFSSTTFKTITFVQVKYMIFYLAVGTIILCIISRITMKDYKILEDTVDSSEKERQKSEKMISKIKEVLKVLTNVNGNVKEGIDIVKSVSNQITDTSSNVANKASEEVSSMTNVIALMDVGMSDITEVESAVDKMIEFSLKNNKVVENGSQNVENLYEEMNRVSSNINNAVQLMDDLINRSSEIAKILDAIEEITDQTNLLALNASIEAVRAGENGKGFLVVADEVRKLAEDSKDSTYKISSILNDITSKINNVSQTIISEKESIELCNTYTNSVKKLFANINKNTEDVIDHSKSVDNKTVKLKSSIEKTLKEVNFTSNNIETAASSMEEISAGINELDNNINNIVDEYNKIDDICERLKEYSDQ